MKHTVLGHDVTMPVEIRDASACAATVLVDAEAAREICAPTGLTPVVRFGRAVCALVFVDYINGDLGRYHEFGLTLMVRGADGKPGVYIPWLPVDQPFTLAAGRQIWGFPKEIADIRITRVHRGTRCELRLDDELVIAVEVGTGIPSPGGLGGASIAAYTHLDGVLRRTPWVMNPSGVRIRPGGTKIELGDHPKAQIFRSLGLPRGALLSSRIGQLRMTFEDAITM